jgi:hypothetical protein
MLKPGMHVRVNLDVDVSYEEATFIKETFANTYNLREITLIPQKVVGEDINYDTTGNIMFESVDTIVTNQLTNIQSDQYNKTLLLDIYRNL